MQNTTIHFMAYQIDPPHAKEELQKHYEQKYFHLANLLMENPKLWGWEVLNEYPKTMKSFEQEDLQSLRALNLQEEWALDCNRWETISSQKLTPSILTLFRHIQELCTIPDFSSQIPELEKKIKYPSWALSKVSGKKQHEIKRIIPLISHLMISTKGSSILDIGGGQGHLSRILSQYHGLDCYSLDCCQEFQELGKKRLKKFPPPEGAGNLTFIHQTFGEPEFENEEDSLFKQTQASLGLHTCGPLAIEHLKHHQEKKGLLNFGCCYQKLNPKKDCQLSAFSQLHPISYTKYALTLASRGHTVMTMREYEIKKRVKFFRSALHLLMSKELHQDQFVTVGSAPTRLYFQDFASYAQEKMKTIPLKLSDRELNTFYSDQQTQVHLQQIHVANLIRWRFGRPLELALLYDRALWLVEQGHRVEMATFFDEEISPRNIGLFIRP